MEYVVFTSEEAQRTQRAVEHFEQHVRRTLPPLKRPFRDISGGDGCNTVLKLDLLTCGNAPDGGGVSVPYTYDGSPYTLSIAWDDNAATIQAAVETQLSLTAGDLDGKVRGGPIATWSVIIEFPDMSLFATNGNITHDLTHDSTEIDGNVRGQLCCLS